MSHDRKIMYTCFAGVNLFLRKENAIGTLLHEFSSAMMQVFWSDDKTHFPATKIGRQNYVRKIKIQKNCNHLFTLSFEHIEFLSC